MEKRLVAALVLTIVIYFGWAYVARKLYPPPPSPPPAAEGPSPAAPAPAPSAETPAAAPASPISASASEAAKEETLRLETGSAIVELTNRGGRVRSWSLKGFESAGRPVDFVPDAARAAGVLPLALAFEDKAILPGINDALFTMTRTDEPDGRIQVAFHWSDGAGSEVEKTIRIPKDGYLADVEVKAIDRGRPVGARLFWGPGLEVEDPKHRSNTYYNSQAVVYDGHTVTRLARRKIDSVVATPPDSPLQWAGMEDQYFTALVLPAGSRGSVTIAPFAQSSAVKTGPSAADLGPLPTVAIALPEGKGQLFVGPKDFGLLTSLGHDLEKAVWFSSFTLIYVCAKPIFLALRWVQGHWAANYGVAIIILTFGLRLLLFPLNQFSMVRMRKVAGEMQRVQPKLKALQAKYKKSKDADARAKLNQETMELYKREGVNPFGGVSGCLPLFIQMPLLWAFFDVLTASVELRGAPFFGWIHDLTHPDPFRITPILMGATMFVQQKMTPTANVDPAQQRMVMFMPIMFTVMFMSLPSGLVLYYFVNNLLGIGQQWLVNRHIARLEAASVKA
ncbi:MAG TPA: membrane protein insertase YidC [Candidatus Polarisedimenticolaceae bacterium]|nr:membrane protein insertase YidC [Candidatus Polarisedimenticolaceae bacterium]